MEHKPIKSSNIHSTAFEDGILEVHYKSGRIYQYRSDEEAHAKLRNAKSPGATMHKMKGTLPYRVKGEKDWRKP